MTNGMIGRDTNMSKSKGLRVAAVVTAGVVALALCGVAEVKAKSTKYYWVGATTGLNYDDLNLLANWNDKENGSGSSPSDFSNGDEFWFTVEVSAELDDSGATSSFALNKLYFSAAGGDSMFIQNGGSVSVAKELRFSRDVGNSNDRYKLKGGSLSAEKLVLGHEDPGSAGTFTITGGALNVTKDILVTEKKEALGYLYIEGGTVTVGEKLKIAGDNAPAQTAKTAIVKQTGGYVNVDKHVKIASNILPDGSGTATYDLLGGLLKIHGNKDGVFVFDNKASTAVDVHFNLSDTGMLAVAGDWSDLGSFVDGTIDNARFKYITYDAGGSVIDDVELTTGNITDYWQATYYDAGSTIEFAGETIDVGEYTVVNIVPEPGTMALLVLGGVAVLVRRRRT